jgi:hypothetical protein
MSRVQRSHGELDLLSLGSHQMRSPVEAARSLLQTVLGGYAGRITEQQRGLLTKAEARCAQAEQAIHRLLTLYLSQCDPGCSNLLYVLIRPRPLRGPVRDWD